MSYEMSKKCFPEALCSVLPSACARAGEHSAAIRFYRNLHFYCGVDVKTQSRSIPIDDNHFHTCLTCLSLRLAFDGRYRRSIVKLIHCMA